MSFIALRSKFRLEPAMWALELASDSQRVRQVVEKEWSHLRIHLSSDATLTDGTVLLFPYRALYYPRLLLKTSYEADFVRNMQQLVKQFFPSSTCKKTSSKLNDIRLVRK